ncbi:Ribosomal protein lysine methyltransferase [Conoideocrella luteorostrata]|uniref:Ribosomal protein lysine methyltransferase n=1 Tax=Conoideocrella luteorostrata TaxID=1105319 RepID=A0AAJ0CYL2_9HYPO|nr:Ribosomal protein lysine methyltransferase [Conoideocrella luteorostrata]
MPLEELLPYLEDEIQDPDEETFLLYSNPVISQNLGFIDPKAETLEVNLSGRDLTIHQSPAVLGSTRAGGTTGAVLWKVAPLFAEWLASPKNPLFSTILGASSTLLELGCGISPLNAFAAAPRIAQYVLSDQPYVQKLVNQNLLANPMPAVGKAARPGLKRKPSASTGMQNIQFRVLDWEQDQVTTSLAAPSCSFDAVVATDCVYNYALVEPFVQTCVDVCMLKQQQREADGRVGSGQEFGLHPCVCVVAQHLRNDDVFRSWLAAFRERFRVWRVREDVVPGLGAKDGFVVHVGVLRGDDS